MLMQAGHRNGRNPPSRTTLMGPTGIRRPEMALLVDGGGCKQGPDMAALLSKTSYSRCLFRNDRFRATMWMCSLFCHSETGVINLHSVSGEHRGALMEQKEPNKMK